MRPILITGFLLLSSVAQAATWYVATNGSDAAAGTNWVTAKQTIQAAVDAAAPSDTVLVSNGVYQTGGRVAPGFALTNRVFIHKPVTVQSVHGPAVTILRGNKPNGDAAVRCVWMTNGATLVGFTLTNGATRTSGDGDVEGGGLWAQSAAVAVSNCVLTGNTAAFHGGGAFGGTLHQCILAGNQAFDNGGGAFASTLNSCTVTSNSAQSGGGSYGGTLNHCTLSGNTALTGAGAYGGTLNHCRLTGNVSTDNGGGAFNAVLNNCRLSGNTAVYGGGAAFGTLNNCLVTGNTAADCGGGTFQAAVNNATVSGNSASTNGGGACLGTLNNSIVYFNTAPNSNNYYNTTASNTCTTPLPAGAGNISNAPLFINAGAGNYRLQTGSPCRDAGNNANAPGSTDLDGNPRIENTTVDMGAYEFQLSATGTLHYVNLHNPAPLWPHASWSTAATNIQDAIDAADAGDTVLVSNGTYQTGGRVTSGSQLTNRVVIDRSITVQSVHGPGVTIIRGAGPPGNAAVRGVWMTNGATLIGFTLTNGATRTFSPDLDGGGVWAQSVSAVISNCIITGNASRRFGGGAFGGTLDNTTLAGNHALTHGGGASHSTLNRCALTGNEAGNGDVGDGGGANASTLNHCTLTGNSTFRNGGGAYQSFLNNCTLSGNTALFGGGAYESTLNNCTLAGNSAEEQGGGTYGGTLNNCIVQFNTALEGTNYFGGTLHNTCTGPMPTNGTGNITNDPLFVSLATTNLALDANSPCINLGHNAFAPGGTDLAGNPRIANTVVDMGAYEFQGAVDPDYDHDGWGNAEEFIAATDPTNAASYFPAAQRADAPAGQMSLLIDQASTGRVYGVYANTNLLQAPQAWTLVPPEQTGTAAALTLTVTNSLPAANYRTGVRLP